VGFEGHPRSITYNSTHDTACYSTRNTASHSKSDFEIRQRPRPLTDRHNRLRMFLPQQNGNYRAIARLKFHSFQYTS
jgi:hypothetical protein